MIKKKRLSMYLPLEIHKELKAMAAIYNTTITVLVMRLIVTLLEQDKEVNK